VNDQTVRLARAPHISPAPKPLRLLFVVLLILGAFLLFWIRHAAHGDSVWNTATYMYVGKTILDGGLPYRDAYDVKGPGIYYFFALGMLFTGQNPLGIHILETLWLALTAWVLACVTARIYRQQAAGYLAAAFLLIYLISYAPNGEITEPDFLIILPMALGVLLLLRAEEHDRLGQWVLAGLSMAAAAMLKLPAAALGIAMMFAAVRQAPAGLGRICARLAALAAGLLVPILLFVFWYYRRGALGDMWTAQFVFVPQYLRAFNAWQSPACVREMFTRPMHLPLYAMGGLAIVGLIPAGRKAWRWPDVLVIVWLAVAALGLFLHGLFFEYHFVPLAAPLAMLSARAIVGWREERAALRVAVVAGVLLFLFMPVKHVPHFLLTESYALGEVRAAKDPWRILAISLRARTSPGDALFLWGNVPHFYLDADRRPPTRFFHNMHLSTPGSQELARPELLAGLEAHKPKFFVVNKSRTIGFGPCPISQFDFYESYLHFAGLQKFLEAGYVVEEETPRYTLYRRNDVAPPVASAEAPSGR
jgi:hypothetical protein